MIAYQTGSGRLRPPGGLGRLLARRQPDACPVVRARCARSSIRSPGCTSPSCWPGSPPRPRPGHRGDGRAPPALDAAAGPGRVEQVLAGWEPVLSALHTAATIPTPTPARPPPRPHRCADRLADSADWRALAAVLRRIHAGERDPAMLLAAAWTRSTPPSPTAPSTILTGTATPSTPTPGTPSPTTHRGQSDGRGRAVRRRGGRRRGRGHRRPATRSAPARRMGSRPRHRGPGRRPAPDRRRRPRTPPGRWSFHPEQAAFLATIRQRLTLPRNPPSRRSMTSEPYRPGRRPPRRAGGRGAAARAGAARADRRPAPPTRGAGPSAGGPRPARGHRPGHPDVGVTDGDLARTALTHLADTDPPRTRVEQAIAIAPRAERIAG